MKTKLTPKVSIIIPVYKVEKYLEQCLDSVINQTLNDIEIIIADDGEHDKCREIIDRYEKIDSRIISVHHPVNGYGARVNICIKMACGEYIGIVEPDDFIEHNMFERLYSYASRLDADVVKSSFIERHEKRNGELDYECRYFAFEYLSKNMPHNRTFSLLDHPTEIAFHPCVWSGIYKTSYLRDKRINFLEAPGAAYVDHKFRLDVCLNTDKIAWLNIAKYHWRVSSDNSSNRNFNVTAALERFHEVHELLNTRNRAERECLSKYMIIEEYRNTLGHVFDKEYSKEQYKHLKENLSFYSTDIIQESPVLNSEEKANILNFKTNYVEFMLRLRMRKERGTSQPRQDNSKAITPKISILISCHADTEYVKNDCLFPIQVGASLTEKRFAGMLYDNEGDNISAKNKSYCELTAQYWAWKNLESDYYGFCHYRRYFDFNKEHISEKVWGIIETPQINDDAIKEYGWDEEAIHCCVDGYDIITAPIVQTSETIYEQYADAFENLKLDLKIESIDCILDIIHEIYPEYYPYAENFFKGHIWCWANMYILRKDVFFNYCEWLFSILEEFEKRTDFSNYSVQCLRTPGHLSERLFNIYLLHLLDNDLSIKWKSIYRVDIKDTTKMDLLSPAFNENNIAIAIPSSDSFSPITCVLLQSIFENSSKHSNYDILVMEDKIAEANKDCMKSVFRGAENFSLRFIDVHKQLHDYKLKPKDGYTIHTYTRLLLPKILKDYEKVVYLDADTVVNADLTDLFNTQLDDNLIGGVRDIRMAMWYGLPGSFQKPILDNQLNMKNPYDYFQGGVLLINLKQFRKEFTVDYLFEVATSQYWDCLDQDVLNYLCRDRVVHVDMAWNVMIKWPIQPSESYAPAFMYNEYIKAHKAPKIVHYAGAYPTRLIPCFTANVDMAEYFWKYARHTLFYETLLKIMTESTFKRLAAELNTKQVTCQINKDEGQFKEAVRFKQRIKRSLVSPIVDILLPKGSKQRYITKKIYFSLRGWEY